MFDRFRKKREEETGGEMIEELPFEESSPDQSSEQEYKKPIMETDTKEFEDKQPKEEATRMETPGSSSEIGIGALMNKRAKLEEAIDYVGIMIKQLKDKRTNLEKDIEEESVDIKNLKEKLEKVREYIDEEREGIQSLVRKRSEVEREADQVGNLVSDLKNKLSGIDKIVDDEGSRIKNIKESRKNESL